MDIEAASYPFADLALARRLERAEAHSNARFVEARARAQPQSGAAWIDVAGAYALFDGPLSPVTQTFGLGLFGPVAHADLEAIEAFLRERGAPVYHEVSPLVDPSLLQLLCERGYHPVECTSVLYRPVPRRVPPVVPRHPSIRVRSITEEEAALWAETTVRGWDEFPDLADFLFDMGTVSTQRADAVSYLAEQDGQPIATGVLCLHAGVALLAGACTVPEARRQGAQRALLGTRLQYAAAQGCDLAMMGAQPGSGSQRNAERQGFRIAYTRIKWYLAG